MIEQVRDYLLKRAPADLGGLSVVGPDYWPVGVIASFSPTDLSRSGPVALAVRDAVEAFLHPLTGGPDREGWPPGRSVFLSDAAAVVESVAGVDFATTIELTLDGIPQGERVDVPTDRVVVAGVVRVLISGSGGGRCS